jgi:hypothetical protein
MGIESQLKRKEILMRYELPILVACIGISILVHALFVVGGFGEPDAARLAVFAAEWHQTGSIHSYTYHVRTSPLYIHSMKIMLDLGMPLGSIPPLINWMSLILGSLTLLPLYRLWKILSGSAVSAMACLFFTLTPAFWLANIYGMAHLVGFTALVISFLLFAESIIKEHKGKTIWLVGSIILACLSVSLKADLILCFGAYLGLVLCHGVTKIRLILLSLLLPVIATGFVIIYANVIIPDMPSLTESTGTWMKSFPFTIEAIMNPANRMIPIKSAGLFLFAAGVLSIGYCIVRQQQLRLLLFALLWSLPPILFWGLKMGNSSRHMMGSLAPIMFIVAVVLIGFFRHNIFRLLAVTVLLVGNYIVGSGNSTVSPPPQLHRLSKIVGKYSGWRHNVAELFAEMDDIENKMYVGNTTIPYVEWELFNAAMSFEVLHENPKTYRLFNESEQFYLIQVQHVQSPTTVKSSEFWFIFTFEPGIEIMQHKKWFKYLEDPRFKYLYNQAAKGNQ